MSMNLPMPGSWPDDIQECTESDNATSPRSASELPKPTGDGEGTCVENIEEMAIRLEGNPAFEQWCLVNSHTDVGMRNARAATKSNPPLRLLEGSVKGHKCFKCADFDDPEETKEHMEFQRRSSVTPGIDSPKTLLGSGSC
jgi:hypothetical protein